MQNRHLARCLAAACLLCGSAGRAEEGLTLAPAADYATPRLIVAPSFPASAPPRFGVVQVDLAGTVAADGSFSPSSVTAPAGQEAFAEAVTGVLKHWVFVPAIDRERCEPTPKSFSTVVWFSDTVEGGRKVEIGTPKRPPPSAASPTSGYAWTGLMENKPQFPASALTGRREGSVEVLMKINPEGRVESAAIRSSTPPGIFDATVLKAARRTHLEWTPPKPDHAVCASRTYDFCSAPGSWPALEYPGCRH